MNEIVTRALHRGVLGSRCIRGCADDLADHAREGGTTAEDAERLVSVAAEIERIVEQVATRESRPLSS